MPNMTVKPWRKIRDTNHFEGTGPWSVARGIVQSQLGVDRKPVFNNGYGYITPEQFSQWYNDVPGVNSSKSIPFELTETATGSGIYEFSSNSYFPIDGELLGNEGRGNNYHFTTEINAAFTYKGGEFLNFTGDDDVWVFINNQLAVDLGGVHGPAFGAVNLDDLGLTVGKTYSINIFHAERQTSGSNFRLQTSLELRPNYRLQNYVYDVDAVDSDQDSLTYSLVKAPTGMTIDPVSGVIEWSPNGLAIPSQLPVTVRVEDSRGGADEQQLTIQIKTVEADLTIGKVTPSGLSVSGQTLDLTGSVTAKITNRGGGDLTQPFNVLFFEDRDVNQTYDKGIDNVLGSITITDSLAAGETQTVIADLVGKVRFSSVPIWGFVDSGDAIAETDETNNLAFSSHDCLDANGEPLPDLVPSYVRIEESSKDTIITARIGNGGAQAVRAGVNVTFYDGNPRNGGTLLGTAQTTTQLDAGTFEDVSLTIPSRTISLDNIWVTADDGVSLDFDNAIRWTDWISATAGIPGSANGNITLANSETISVTYNGEIFFAQTSGGTNYWNPSDPYLSETVKDSPPTSDIVSLIGGNSTLNTLTFSKPVINPILGIVSLGANGKAVVYDFDIDFNILSVGRGYFGDGTLEDLPGNVLRGVEGHGAIQFPGVFRSISWVAPIAEGWHGFTVGIVDAASENGQIDECDEANNFYHVGSQSGEKPEPLDNQKPEFASTPLEIASVNQLFRYNAVAIDPDNDVLRYGLSIKPNGMAVDPNTGIVVWQPTFEQAGQNYDVVLRVQDGRGGIDLQAFQLTVPAINTDPTITSTPPETAVAGLPYQYRVHAQDAEGDNLTFQLAQGPEGATIDGRTGVVNFRPTTGQLGNQSFGIAVNDGKGGTASQAFTLGVVADSPNTPPTITSTPRRQATLERPYAYEVEALDANGDPLTFSLTTAPTGLTVDETGLITWRPTAGQFGVNSVGVQVSDGRGGIAIQNFEVAVGSQGSNQSPTITSTPVVTGTINREYRYNLIAQDPDGDPLQWSLETAPTGMSVDSQRGTIRWLPTVDQIGTHNVAVRVFDSFGGFSEQTFDVAVRGANTPPVITSTPLAQAVSDRPYK
ncbi:fibro-slime domain-containing protein [Kovacikia minuta CCNUW1]|uniref:putative Ig domain-containing protein n=1 Tax=Kovacikia minuta TaxID=2931930 RepID=UPI001CCF6857|nr:putative Ig domain-containing protein [Kovacikia minuta]UBF28855.1 fibro-slime domain-containing protein [Kovacikia minuta CCNUW1]